MSEEDVTTLRSTYEAFNRGDLDAIPFTLGRQDVYGVVWLLGRLGRVSVLGALHKVVGHLPFDDARVRAEAPRREQLVEQFFGGLLTGRVERFGGKSRRARRPFGGRRAACA